MAEQFIFAADLHLGRRWAQHPELTDDGQFAFQQLLDAAVATKSDLILGGDVFDRAVQGPAVIYKFKSAVDLARNVWPDLTLYGITGQHDRHRDAYWLDVLPRAFSLGITLACHTVAGVRVYGFDWVAGADVPDQLAAIPENAEILVTHQVWREHMGDLVPPEIEISQVPRVETVLTGDYHVTRMTEGIGANGQTVRLYSPGSTWLQAIDESEQKYYFVVAKGKESGQIEVAMHLLRSRPVYRFHAATKAEAAALVAATLPAIVDLPERMQKPIVEISLSGEAIDMRGAVEEAYSGRSFLWISIQFDEKPKAGAEPTTATDKSMAAALVDYLSDQVALSDAVRLWDAEDPAAVLRDIKEAFFAERTR